MCYDGSLDAALGRAEGWVHAGQASMMLELRLNRLTLAVYGRHSEEGYVRDRYLHPTNKTPQSRVTSQSSPID